MPPPPLPLLRKPHFRSIQYCRPLPLPHYASSSEHAPPFSRFLIRGAPICPPPFPLYAWSAKTRRAPSRQCRYGRRVCGHATTAMHDTSTPCPPPYIAKASVLDQTPYRPPFTPKTTCTAGKGDGVIFGTFFFCNGPGTLALVTPPPSCSLATLTPLEPPKN